MINKGSIGSKHEQHDESSCWHQLMEGDRRGLEGLYVLFSRELFRYGMAVQPDRTLVKDCIQELFIDLWKYRKSIKGTDNVKKYLCRSLSNRMYREMHLEKRRREQDPLEVRESLYDSADPKSWPSKPQAEEEEIFKLRDAVGNLPVRQREIIQHVYFDKLSSEETAKKMGIAVQSVYTLTWKAISKLKQSLKPKPSKG